ncbi:unnamed protein product, partial [Pylaiella littoralis]
YRGNPAGTLQAVLNPAITKTELLQDPLSTVYPSKRRG